MATAKQIKAAADSKKAARTPLVDAPKAPPPAPAAAKEEPVKAVTGQDVDPRSGTDNARDPAVDARVDQAAMDAVRLADAVIAPAPTPNQNNALEDANEHPGAGGAPVVPPAPPRRRTPLRSDEMVEVEPTKTAFNILDEGHEKTFYPAGTTQMPRDHAEHWYAEDNGVVIAKKSK